MIESNYEKSLNLALETAFSSLKERDLKEIAFKSGASLEENQRLRLAYLNRTALVDLQQEHIKVDAVPAEKSTSILILHYLLCASGAPLTGRMISFKEVPQGSLYFQPFRNRVILSMLGFAENDASGLEAATNVLGGERVPAGDLSYRFRVFPYVPVQYVWYRGEEGTPPDLNILFDASIPEYLSTEDIVVMCSEINQNLKSLSSQQPGKPSRTMGKGNS